MKTLITTLLDTLKLVLHIYLITAVSGLLYLGTTVIVATFNITPSVLLGIILAIATLLGVGTPLLSCIVDILNNRNRKHK